MDNLIQLLALVAMFVISAICASDAMNAELRMPARIAYAVVAALFGIPPLVRLWVAGVLG